ncbi:MAG TPA: carboxypeptidase-like regulatory domain-containing protein, partial [Longimicrobiales bacterium]
MAPPLRHRAAAFVASAVLALLAASGSLAAQSTGSVRGHVTDAVTGRGLSSAQVYIKGTHLGALTSAEGSYVINAVPTGQQVVRVENLGFKAVEQTVRVATGAAATADFSLSQEAIALDEMVVTGTAGATTKRVVGNTVSTVQAARITQVAPVENVQQMLTARAPGVVLMANAGTVGASSRVRIRGAGTLNANTNPVVYVDGVRMLAGTQDGYNTSGGLVQGTSALDAINPNDIESIEVIKGPAAATLSGAEAAGGVIQIITKKGRTGGEGVHWDASLEQGDVDWKVSHPTNFTWCGAPHVLASPANYPGCAGAPATTILHQDPLINDPTGHGSSLRTGPVQDLNLSARGGGANYNFYLSGEHNFEDGVFVNNYSHRNTARGNFGFVPSEKLNFQVNAAYAQQHLQLPLNDNASNGILRNAYRGQPGAVAPWSAGWRGLPSWIGNTYDNETREERTTLGLTANYQPLSWWKSHITFGMDKNDRVNQETFKIDTTGRAPFGGDAAKGNVNQFMPVEHYWSVDAGSSIQRALSKSLDDELSAGLQFNKRQ